MTELQSRQESADSTKMLTALVRLRGALQEVRLPLELPTRRGPAHGPARRWSTSSRTTSSRA